MIPSMLSDRLSHWFFHSPDKRQSWSCIVEKGSSQQQSNIPVGFAKYQERQCSVTMENSFVEYIQGSLELSVMLNPQRSPQTLPPLPRLHSYQFHPLPWKSGHTTLGIHHCGGLDLLNPRLEWLLTRGW